MSKGFQGIFLMTYKSTHEPLGNPREEQRQLQVTCSYEGYFDLILGLLSNIFPHSLSLNFSKTRELDSEEIGSFH